jgi:Putative zinc-finger
MPDHCDDTRNLLAEVSLGIADGAERARVLDHVAGCAECRGELERHSAVADGLLALAPEAEPPPGFEVGVLRAIDPPAPKRRRLLPRLAVVGAVAAAVVVTALGMQAASSDDRRLADQYRAALAEANGTYFGSARLSDPAGRPGGVLFVYRGSPSWILVTVAPRHRAESTRAEIVARDGRRLPLSSFRLVDGAWGGSIPLDLSDVAAVHLVRADGRSTLVAEL